MFTSNELQNRVSTHVDEIAKPDFTELYENVAEVYDFFDAEYSRTGNLEEVEKELVNKFEGYELYKDKFIKVNIDQIFIKDEKIEVKITFEALFKREYVQKFGQGYTDGYLDDKDWMFSVETKFNVVEIEKEINKRFSLMNSAIKFWNDGYKFNDAVVLEGNHLFKKVNIKYDGIITPFSDKKKELARKKTKYYFNLLKDLLSKNFEIKDSGGNFLTVTDADAEKFNIMKFSNNSFVEEGIYLVIRNLSFQKAKKTYELLDKQVNEIDNLLEEKKKTSKVLKKAKHSLWLTLSPAYMLENLELLISKFHELKEKGEIFSVIACDLLSNIMLDISDVDFSVLDYDVNEYNKLLDAILKEDLDIIIDYYKKRLISFSESDDKAGFLQILLKIIKISDSKRINIFDDIDNIDEILTESYIDMLMDSLSEVEKITFINKIYSNFLIKDLDKSSINLDKYKNICNYPIKDYVLDKFYILLANVLVSSCLNHKSKDIILRPLGEIVEELGMGQYIDDIEEFEDKYLDYFYNKLYKYHIDIEKSSIDNIGEDEFGRYKNLDEKNIETFIENILIPHILSAFHKMDKQEVTKHIKLLEQGCMIEVLDELKYSDIVKDIIFQSWNEKKHCKVMLDYWLIISEMSIFESYSMIAINEVLKEKFDKILIDIEILDVQGKLEDLDEEIDFIIDYLSVKTHDGFDDIQDFLKGIFLEKLIDLASKKLRIKLCKIKGLPNKIYVRLAEDKDDDVVLALLYGATSLEHPIGNIIATHPSEKVITMFISRYNLSEETQKIIGKTEKGMFALMNNQKSLKSRVVGQIANYGSDKLKMRLLDYTSELSRSIQYVLIQDSNDDIVMKLLSTQKSIYTGSANWIVEKRSNKIKKKFIKQFKLSGNRQELIAKDSEEIVLYMLEHQKTLRGGAGYALSNHPSLKVRRTFARWNLGDDIALQLARKEEDEELLLNLLIAGKKSYSDNLLLELSRKGSEEVGYKILEEFKELSTNICLALADHPSLKVKRRLAKWNLGDDIALQLVRKEEDEELLLNLLISGKKEYSDELLLELARKDSEEVGYKIMEEFKELSSNICLVLADHSSLKVKRKLAIWNLGEDVSFRLARNEEDEELLLNLIAPGKEDYYNSMLKALAMKESEKIGLEIINRFQSLPISVIDSLKRHSSERVRTEIINRVDL